MVNDVLTDQRRQFLAALEQERQERDKRIEEAANIKKEIEDNLPSF